MKRPGLRFVIAAAALGSAGCARYPDPVAPPAQRAAIEPVSLPQPETMIDLGGPQAEAAILKDIARGTSDSQWRWTGQAPAVRVPLRNTAGLKFHADFAIADDTFRQTGPVTIRWMVNDRVLDTVRYAKPGSYVFEKPVPAEWLKPNAENAGGAAIDKVYIASTDGAKLGIILSRIGFLK